jgi:hypothetical protein
MGHTTTAHRRLMRRRPSWSLSAGNPRPHRRGPRTGQNSGCKNGMQSEGDGASAKGGATASSSWRAAAGYCPELRMSTTALFEVVQAMTNYELYLFPWAYASLGGLAAELIRWRRIKHTEYIKQPLYWVISLMFIAASGLMALLFEARTPLLAVFVGFAFPLAIGTLAAISDRDTSFETTRTAELKDSLLKAEAAVDASPDKTRPMWELSRVQLELYITRNLGQVKNIFWITVVVTTAGFTLVLLTSR